MVIAPAPAKCRSRAISVTRRGMAAARDTRENGVGAEIRFCLRASPQSSCVKAALILRIEAHRKIAEWSVDVRDGIAHALAQKRSHRHRAIPTASREPVDAPTARRRGRPRPTPTPHRPRRWGCRANR